ncbi:hypothetical protein AMTRI_Chr01g137670 [Amborella trichopoda]
MSSVNNPWILFGVGAVSLFLMNRRLRNKVMSKDEFGVAMSTKADENFGAFMAKFQLLPPPKTPQPLSGLTFAVKDIFDVEGYVTGFGNPDWARTHEAAKQTAPAVLALIEEAATCIGKTVMDEMAYSINGENKHYGTPTNPCAASRIPGGSSSGSAVAVAAGLVDFALGTDTGGSVRVPAAFCGILGFRPSHGAVSTQGVIPMSQSFDTVGWFSRDPGILSRVGQVLLPLSHANSKKVGRIIIADDCFQYLTISSDRVTQIVIKSIEKLIGSQVITHANFGEYMSSKVPTLKPFIEECENHGGMIPSFAALSSAMRLLQRYEFKRNHEEWVNTTKPDLGPGILERVQAALDTTDDNIDLCHTIRSEMRAALSELLEDDGILIIPTAPGPPPELQTEGVWLENFRAKAFSALAIAGMSGSCQVTIPLGMHELCPVAVSFLARHGADFFLLETVQTMYGILQEQVALL